MARDFARAFYKSKEWQQVRDYALMRDAYLCQICGKPAEEVHHIIHLDPENIWDPKVTLDPNNLQCLCRDCHMRQHDIDREAARSRAREENSVLEPIEFDSNGYPVKKERKGWQNR